MRDFSHAFDEDDVIDEVDIDKVALSPDHYVYENYEDIPYIPSPRFLMVKDKTIIADGWLIRVQRYQAFLDFVGGLVNRWNADDEETKRQLNGFIEAVEAEVCTAFPEDPEGAQEEDFDRRS